MIPNYQQFMRPLLEILQQHNGQEVKLRAIINALADRFGLTEDERNETLPSGRQSILDNRVGWARTYLTKAGLLKATRRAHFVITARGAQALLDTDESIDNEYLKQFDEFIAFKEHKSEPNDAPESTGAEQSFASNTNEITPDEALREAYQTINEALATELLQRTRDVTPACFEDLLIKTFYLE